MNSTSFNIQRKPWIRIKYERTMGLLARREKSFRRWRREDGMLSHLKRVRIVWSACRLYESIHVRIQNYVYTFLSRLRVVYTS